MNESKCPASGFVVGVCRQGAALCCVVGLLGTLGKVVILFLHSSHSVNLTVPHREEELMRKQHKKLFLRSSQMVICASSGGLWRGFLFSVLITTLFSLQHS